MDTPVTETSTDELTLRSVDERIKQATDLILRRVEEICALLAGRLRWYPLGTVKRPVRGVIMSLLAPKATKTLPAQLHDEARSALVTDLEATGVKKHRISLKTFRIKIISQISGIKSCVHKDWKYKNSTYWKQTKGTKLRNYETKNTLKHCKFWPGKRQWSKILHQLFSRHHVTSYYIASKKKKRTFDKFIGFHSFYKLCFSWFQKTLHNVRYFLS